LASARGVCFGHEFVADIVTVGEDVAGFVPGDRVVVSFLIACGTCKRCRRGLSGGLPVGSPNSGLRFGIFGDWGGAACDLIGSRTNQQ